MSYLEQNLVVIEQRWPELVSRLIDHGNAKQDIAVERLDLEGHKSIRVNGTLLASAYDRAAEAKLQYDFFYHGYQQMWLYGVALGDLPELLLKSEQLQRLDVVLITPGIFCQLLEYLDHSRWLADERVHLHFVDDVGPRVFHPCAMLASEFYLMDEPYFPLRDRMIDFMMYHHVRESHQFTPELQGRIADNEPYITADHDVGELFGQCPGSEVFVVGAGPTLRATVAKIKATEPRVVVAVDRAVKELLRNGVIPDYVLAIDGHSSLVYEYLDVPKKAEVLGNSGLVYSPRVHTPVIEDWPGPRYSMFSWEPIYDDVKTRITRAELWVSGSVILPATDLAVKLGAKSVVFFGADFGFPGGLESSEGETVKAKESVRITVEDGHGNQVASRNDFRSYLRFIEDYVFINRAKVSFFNSSRDGARIEGTEYWGE